MQKTFKFINNTNLDDKAALTLTERLRDLIKRGEYERTQDVAKANRFRDIFQNKIWSDEEKAFFESLNASPYQFAVQRPLINNLISRQRNRRFTFDIVPTDINAYKRQRRGRDEFVEKHFEEFDSVQEAQNYYDHYADDEYARGITAFLHNVRAESKAKYVESETFENGLITGVDFLKCIYSKKNNREGGIEITRRPINAVVYDRSTVDYDLKGCSYIGEVHRLTKEQLQKIYPEKFDEIEELYQEYSAMGKTTLSTKFKDWEFLYNFDRGEDKQDGRIAVAEIWYEDLEDRFVVSDLENDTQRIVKYEFDEEGIRDNLMTQVLLELREKAGEDEAIAELLQSDEVEQYITDIVDTRFEISTTKEPIFYKSIFTWNALFEHQRSPLPTGSHPYMPFYASYNEGDYRGLIEDIADVIVAINKTLAFRDLMMAHGAKGLVVIDHDTLVKSGYSPEDVADQWTELGGMLILKLKPGRRIQDVFDTVTTIGQGLAEINNVLADLDNRLYLISGVNLAQLGVMERQTAASGYRQQLAEGEANNGLIFDNFIRTLECFYNDKVVPLLVHYMKVKKPYVLRLLGDEFSPWIEINYDEEFDLFEQAIRAGEFATVLVPKEDNPRINAERSARYMEFAMAGFIDPDVALEFSDDPNRFKIIKRNKELSRKRVVEQTKNMVDMQMLQQMFVEDLGLSATQALEMMEKLKTTKMLEEIQQLNAQKGKQKQFAQGLGNIQQQANEPNRLAGVDNSTQL